MSEPKIAREVAAAEVQRWAEAMENPEGATESLVRAVMADRISFDEKAETFLVRLKSPVTLGNGELFDCLPIVQPTAGQYRDCSKGNRDGMDTTLRLIAEVSGKALGVVERVKKADLMVLMDCLNFFG